MKTHALVACLLVGCKAGGTSVALVRHAGLEGTELVVETCAVNVKDGELAVSRCERRREIVPVLIDEREVAPRVTSQDAQHLATALRGARDALASCSRLQTSTVELRLRIADDGRAIGADAGADRVELANCVITALAGVRFPPAQRGSQAVLAVPAGTP